MTGSFFTTSGRDYILEGPQKTAGQYFLKKTSHDTRGSSGKRIPGKGCRMGDSSNLLLDQLVETYKVRGFAGEGINAMRGRGGEELIH